MVWVVAWLAVPSFPICSDGQKYIVPPGYACRQLCAATRRDSWDGGGDASVREEGPVLNCLNMILLRGKREKWSAKQKGGVRQNHNLEP